MDLYAERRKALLDALTTPGEGEYVDDCITLEDLYLNSLFEPLVQADVAYSELLSQGVTDDKGMISWTEEQRTKMSELRTTINNGVRQIRGW